jgi:hypothetical protein
MHNMVSSLEVYKTQGVKGLSCREGIASLVVPDPGPTAIRLLPREQLLEKFILPGRFAELLSNNEVQGE